MDIPRSLSADMVSMRHIIETLVSEGRASPSNLWGAENERTSSSFGTWLEGLREKSRRNLWEPGSEIALGGPAATPQADTTP